MIEVVHAAVAVIESADLATECLIASGTGLLLRIAKRRPEINDLYGMAQARKHGVIDGLCESLNDLLRKLRELKAAGDADCEFHADYSLAIYALILDELCDDWRTYVEPFPTNLTWANRAYGSVCDGWRLESNGDRSLHLQCPIDSTNPNDAIDLHMDAHTLTLAVKGDFRIYRPTVTQFRQLQSFIKSTKAPFA